MNNKCSGHCHQGIELEGDGFYFAKTSTPKQSIFIPEGWKLVPAEPTDDMIIAFSEAWYSRRQVIDDPDMIEAYHDMLSVAPKYPNNVE